MVKKKPELAMKESAAPNCDRHGNHDAERLAVDIRAIAKRAAAKIKRPHVDHSEYPYDEHGLPK
jgi:hypothetical protein